MKRLSAPQFLLLLLFLYFTSCAPTRFVKPLAAKEQAVNVSLGGPLISYSDLTVPMPFVTVTYGYGFDSTLTGFGSVNITSALFGNAQVELGVNKQLFKQKNTIPGISVNPVANVIYRSKEALKLYPQLDINVFWNHNKNRNLLYAGLSNWFELSNKKAFDQKQQPQWLLSPMIGESFYRKKWSIQVEIKMLAINVESDKTVSDYKTPFNHHGAAGIYIGYTRKFK